jgi:uncharacterized protein YaeQ
MAAGATILQFEVALSDVDRSVYETIDLRVAQHPSETIERLLVRTLAYGLAYEDGIAFSKEGIASVDAPPISVTDPTGVLLHWIDVGAPSAERLHKASKAARVSVYTHEASLLAHQTAGKTIHKADDIEVWAFDPAFIGRLARKIGRRTRLEVTRNDGSLYVTSEGETFETQLSPRQLSALTPR